MSRITCECCGKVFSLEELMREGDKFYCERCYWEGK